MGILVHRLRIHLVSARMAHRPDRKEQFAYSARVQDRNLPACRHFRRDHARVRILARADPGCRFNVALPPGKRLIEP